MGGEKIGSPTAARVSDNSRAYTTKIELMTSDNWCSGYETEDIFGWGLFGALAQTALLECSGLPDNTTVDGRAGFLRESPPRAPGVSVCRGPLSSSARVPRRSRWPGFCTEERPTGAASDGPCARLERASGPPAYQECACAGLIHVGDQVHEVNGVSVKGRAPLDVVNLLVSQSSAEARVVCEPIDGLLV